MKEQYVIGVPQKNFIRIMGDMHVVHCSLTKQNAINNAEMFSNKKTKFKIYKLVEIN
jgi:hypothetical protein